MTAYHLWDTQQAIYTKLYSDATLMGMITAIYDYAPASALFPYVVLADFNSSDGSTKDLNGLEVFHTLHIFSQSLGKREAETIMKRIHELLHNHNLSTVSHKVVNMRFSNANMVLEADGITRHLIARFKMAIFEN